MGYRQTTAKEMTDYWRTDDDI